jgi:pseudouridine kinase
VREACAAANVDLSLSITGRDATGTYLVVLDRNGELISAINDMRAIESLSVAQLEKAADSLRAADMLVADCNIEVDCLEWICRFSAERNVRLVVEPVSVPKAKKLLAFDRIAPLFAITPNRQQIEAMTGERDEKKAIAKLHTMGFTNIVLHRGGQGALVSSAAAIVDVPSIHADLIADVTGAGDASVAGLIFGLLHGYTLADAARLGQAAASIKLSTRESVASSLNPDAVVRLARLS